MLSRGFLTETERRKRQIDTLKIFNDNVSEIIENSEYRVEFKTNNNKMFIDVKLCSEFPYEKPLLQVNPQIIHPWVGEDSCTIIGAPGLISYTIHSDLGRVVQAIIREFEQKPPQLLEELTLCKNDINAMHSGNSNSSNSSPSFSGNSPVQQLTFPNLQCLTIEELVDLRDDIDLQDKYLENLPQCMEVNKCINELMNDIESLANENISKQSVLEKLKEDIIERHEVFCNIKNNFEILKVKHSQLLSLYTPHAIQMALAESATRADEDAEFIAQTFIDGVIDCETFLRKYELKKSLSHTRKAYQERLSHQLSQLDKAT